MLRLLYVKLILSMIFTSMLKGATEEFGYVSGPTPRCETHSKAPCQAESSTLTAKSKANESADWSWFEARSLQQKTNSSNNYLPNLEIRNPNLELREAIE